MRQAKIGNNMINNETNQKNLYTTISFHRNSFYNLDLNEEVKYVIQRLVGKFGLGEIR